MKKTTMQRRLESILNRNPHILGMYLKQVKECEEKYGKLGILEYKRLDIAENLAAKDPSFFIKE